jgi:hypothetical protein
MGKYGISYMNVDDSPPTTFHIDSSIGLYGTIIRLKNKGSIHLATTLFYILQKYYLNEHCIFLEVALSCHFVVLKSVVLVLYPSDGFLHMPCYYH